MIKWIAMLGLAVMAGGCAVEPTNSSWADRPPVLLPEPETVPPSAAPAPPPPPPYTPPLPVIDPGPGHAYSLPADPVVETPAVAVAEPKTAPAGAKARRSTAPRHPYRHGYVVSGTVVSEGTGITTTTPTPAPAKPKTKPKSRASQT
jgi:hypothetical protein